MACENTVRVGDTGTALQVELLENCTTPIDISGATTLEIIIQRPDLTTVTKTASYVTDGTDGQITADTEAGDITMSGTYKIQANIVLPAWSGKSAVGEFVVEDNLV